MSLRIAAAKLVAGRWAMPPDGKATVPAKRIVLRVVAGCLTVTASLAIGILLFGDFGTTEGRILGTTALLAGYGLLALPGTILLDQGRLPRLGVAVVVLAGAAASLNVAAVWAGEAPDALGKAIGTAVACLLASAQTAALVGRQRKPDPPIVRRLFAVSTALAAVAASMVAVLLWARIDREGYARALGALVVLDALVVVLQPILARARSAGMAIRLRILVEPGETVELTVEASDLAAAAAKAIRTVEREGRRVLLLEMSDRSEVSVAAREAARRARPRPRPTPAGRPGRPGR